MDTPLRPSVEHRSFIENPRDGMCFSLPTGNLKSTSTRITRDWSTKQNNNGKSKTKLSFNGKMMVVTHHL